VECEDVVVVTKLNDGVPPNDEPPEAVGTGNGTVTDPVWIGGDGVGGRVPGVGVKFGEEVFVSLEVVVRVGSGMTVTIGLNGVTSTDA